MSVSDGHFDCLEFLVPGVRILIALTVRNVYLRFWRTKTSKSLFLVSFSGCSLKFSKTCFLQSKTVIYSWFHPVIKLNFGFHLLFWGSAPADAGADINLACRDGASVLNSEIPRVLISPATFGGVDIFLASTVHGICSCLKSNLKPLDGSTPVFHASQFGRVDCLQCLIN